MARSLRSLLAAFVLLALAQAVQAQEHGYDPATGVLRLEEVAQLGPSLDTLAADQLFHLIEEFVELRFAGEDVARSPVNRRITISGDLPTSEFREPGYYPFTLTIETRTGRFRYEFTANAYYSSKSGRVPFSQQGFLRRDLLSAAETRVMGMMETLRLFVQERATRLDH